MEDNDAQLQLKKRARRRLVGAVAFASVVAVVLPMIMDHQPRQPVPEVEIRIPGQDEKPFAPKFAAAPVDKAPQKIVPLADSAPAEAKGDSEAAGDKAADKPAEAAPEKPADKTPPKAPEKSDKTASKPDKPAADAASEAKRAAAILAGQPSATPAPAAKPGEYVILIGAFANEDNVKNLRAKLAERNVKTYVEPLDTPGGKKTRVRAGPFASREAADKALERMKQVGVSGVIAGK